MSIQKFFIAFLLIISAYGNSYAEKTNEQNPDVSSCESDTIRLLAFGNSFASDALKKHLHEMLTTADIPPIISFLQVPSCTLKMHLEYLQKDTCVFKYTIIDANGKTTSQDEVSSLQVLKSQRWTHISLQQESVSSGRYETIEAYLPTLMEEIRSQIDHPVKFCWHQTWSYANGKERDDFEEYYNSDSFTMYEAIAEASRQTLENYDFEILVPSGTAIQNARTWSPENDYTRDFMHLSEEGMYIAACAWYEALTGKDCQNNEYVTAGIGEEEVKMDQLAAHLAILSPYEISQPYSNRAFNLDVRSYDIKKKYDRIIITFPEEGDNAITLYDITGRLLYSAQSAGSYYEVPILKKGMLLLRINGNSLKLFF